MSGILNDRAVISVSGPEATNFLQGLTTNDIDRLAPNAPLYSALLTPQGKVLFDFLLSKQDEAVFLDCALIAARALLKRLTMYRLRAKVELSLCEDMAVIWGETEGWQDPRLWKLGTRQIGKTDGSDASAEYLSRRLELSVPEGADFGSDKMFALDAGLEELNGVSFDKGCYVGQELTARMKHRGTARKRLLLVSSLDGSDLSSSGTELRSGNTALGEITSTYGARGFALIRLDRLREIGDAPLDAGERPVRVTKPAWLAAGLDE